MILVPPTINLCAFGFVFCIGNVDVISHQLPSFDSKRSWSRIHCWASCQSFCHWPLFTVSKREGDSSLMQLKEEFRTYEALRREHDAQIVQIATEAGLRIAPDQWSSLLYGDSAHKSHMQSIIDKLQTPQSFGQSVQVNIKNRFNVE